MIVNALGIVDLSAAILLAVTDVPIIGQLKWVIIVILIVKGVPSILAN